jgi:integrase
VGTIINFERFVDRPEETKGSITRKSGSKKLYVDFYYHGARIVKTTGMDDTQENREKAQKWLDRVMERIENGTFVFAEAFPGAPAEEKAFHAQHEGWEYAPEPQDVLFGDYTSGWVKRILEKCPSKTKRGDHKKIIDYWLLPYFGKMTFHQITGVALKEFLPTLVQMKGKKEGKPLSASRIRNILIPLRAVWYDACEEHRWDLSDPFVYVRKHLPKRAKNHPEVFRFDEWMNVVRNIDPFYRPVAETMIITGMIGSEIAGFRREDIQGGKMVIQNSVVREHEKADLKTEYRGRKLPITSALRERLDIALHRPEGKYLFTMKSGRIFDVDSFRKNPWTTAFKKAGLSYKVPYTTRHSFAAWALTLRMDPNRLVNLMGHGSKKMIYEVYGNYVEGLETDAGKILDYFGKDFIELKEKTTSPFAIKHGESTGESGKVEKDN